MTAIYVTHDQEECFSISDRVAIMNDGLIEQLAKPEEIYSSPQTQFVAKFVGFENFFYGEIKDSSGKYHFISEKGGYETPILDQTKIQRKTVIAAFRPNGFEILSSDQKDQPLIPGLIRVQTYLGKGYRYLIDTELGELVVDHTENKFSINTQIFLKPLPEMMVLL